MNRPDSRRLEFRRETLDALQAVEALATVLMDSQVLKYSTKRSARIMEVDIDVRELELGVPFVVNDDDIFKFDQTISDKCGSIRMRDEIPEGLYPFTQLIV